MRRVIAIAAAVGVLLLLVIAQLVLPGIAAQQLRDRLARSGDVVSVQVDAFPAIQLLWHQADKVVVRLRRYRSTSGDLGGQLAQAADVGSLDASADEVDAGLLTLRNATLSKRGDQLTGRATITESDLRNALPGVLQGVQPVASGGGQLTFRGTATLLGVTASADATVRPESGRLVLQPDLPILSLVTLTLFDNPHVYVDSVDASALGSGRFTVSAHARLH